MVRHRGLFLLCVLAACGGGDKKPKPVKPEKPVVVKPPPETAASREAKRKAAALAIVPEGSNCLPPALKEPGAPQLELVGIGADAVLCAVDTDPTRLLGDVGCWKVDLRNMGNGTVPLVYQDATPQPGHSIGAKIVDGCAWGFCTPGKNASAATAALSWNTDGKRVAMLVGTDVHLFDLDTKKHVSTFGIGGDKGVTGTATAIHFVGDAIVIEGGEDGTGAWVFKADGSATGQIMALGGKDEKPLSSKKGSFSVLDPIKVAIADHGMETFTEYELATGKRTKAVRKPPKLPCKPAEIEAFWADGDKVTDKCKDAIAKADGPWIGATAVMGSKSLLFVMKGERFGELAIVDPKTLVESKKALKMPWCGEAAADAAPPPTEKKSMKAVAPAAKDDDAAAPPATEGKSKSSTRGAVQKGGDPQDGGD